MTKTSANHTPTPWTKARVAYSEQSRVCGPSGQNKNYFVANLGGPDHAANAAFIVKACNNFDQMLAALQMVQGMDIDPVIQRAIDTVVKNATASDLTSSEVL